MKLLISALMLAVSAAPSFALTTAQNRADGGVTIRANVSNGVVLDPGDQISFQYQSARDAAVIVFDIDTQGHVSLLHDDPIPVGAHESRTLPERSDELFAEGEPGVEFVFALAVADPNAIDADAFRSLQEETRTINGDPFIAANMIAAELVRDISQHTVHMGYTYFYVSERVEYPCYLCGTCDGSALSSECEGYRIAQNFDRGVALAYPLARGYDMVEVSSSTQTETVDETAASPAMPDESTEVNFYPYGSEVHYADPMAVNLWYDYGWYDPWYWYYPYSYPYYGSYFSIGFGWGWGWGWGCGGYYYSGCYNPYYGCGYYPYYGDGYYPSNVTRYKSQYKSGGATTLAGNRTYASKTDSDLRVASKGMKTAPATANAWRSTKSVSKSGTQVAKGGYSSSHRVKTSVSGVTRNTWAKGRSGSSYRNVPVYRSQRTSKSGVFQPKSGAGKSVMDRSGYKRSGGSAVTKQRGGAYAPQQRGTTTRSKGSYAPGRSSGSRPSGTSAPRMGGSGYKGGHSSGAMRGSSGGSRGMGGGGMRSGGGFKGGGRGR